MSTFSREYKQCIEHCSLSVDSRCPNGIYIPNVLSKSGSKSTVTKAAKGCRIDFIHKVRSINIFQIYLNAIPTLEYVKYNQSPAYIITLDYGVLLEVVYLVKTKRFDPTASC